jgi:hypothetical protein
MAHHKDKLPQTANLHQQMPPQHQLARTKASERAGQVPIEQEIKKRKGGWISHTLQKPTFNITRQSLEWNPKGKHKVDRPRQTRRRSTDAEARAARMSQAELNRASKNRVRWRRVVAVLCSLRNKEEVHVSQYN